MSAVLLPILLPIAGALAVGLLSRRPNVRDGATVLTSIFTFLAVIRLVPGVMDGGRPGVELIEVLPGISLALEVEPLGLLFALVASGLWIVTSLYAFGYMRGHAEENQTRFFVCFAVAIAAALGVAFSRNLFTLFVFYEGLTLSTYPLVTHHQTEEAKKAGRVYLGILLSTSVCFLLLAIVWTWLVAGTLRFTPGGILAGHIEGGALVALLALYAFGTGKAALMPFHRWLPAAMVAPTPVSALLHAVAVVKAGVFAILKIVVYVFGIDLLAETGASRFLMVVAGATIITSSVIALKKDNLKARLAYSTISQLSYIVLGAAFARPAGVIGGAMHIATHALGKITLFFCAGAILVATHKKRVSELDGIGRRMPLTMTAFTIGSLSVIGLPPTGGAWSKWFLGLGAVDADALAFLAVLMVSSLLSVCYLMPVVIRAFFRPPPEGEKVGIGEAPALCVGPLLFTALGTVALFFVADPLMVLIRGILLS